MGSILGLAEAEEQGLTPQAVRDKRAIPEDELCTKLWVLKDTLLKLGFPGNRVEEALKHVLAYFAGIDASNAARQAMQQNNITECMESVLGCGLYPAELSEVAAKSSELATDRQESDGHGGEVDG